MLAFYARNLLQCNNFLPQAIKMFTAEQIRQQLQDTNLRKLSEKLDLHYMTVWRFMQCEGEPSYRTVKALSDYLVSRSQVAND